MERWLHHRTVIKSIISIVEDHGEDDEESAAKKKKKETLAEWRVRAIATRDEAREALAKTPAKGHPSSKFHQRRVIDARHWTQEAEIAERVEERLEGE